MQRPKSMHEADARRPGDEYAKAPSVSWTWINDTRQLGQRAGRPTGHILPMDFLDGRPIRQAALGDLDGDGDTDVFAAVGAPTLGRLASQDDLVLLNDGNGNLRPYDQSLGDTDSTSVALGDVNGDGAKCKYEKVIRFSLYLFFILLGQLH